MNAKMKATSASFGARTAAVNDFDSDAASSKDYLALLLKEKKKVLVGAFAGIVLGCLYYALAGRVYQASTIVRIEEYAPLLKISNEDALQKQTQAKDYVSTKLAELKNLALADRVLRLPEVRELFYQAYPKAMEAPKTSQYQAPLPALEKYLTLVSVKQISGTSLVGVNVKSPNPSLAALLASSHVEQFTELLKEQRRGMEKEAREALSMQEADARKRLMKAEEELVAYAKKTGIVTTDGGRNLEADRLRAIQKLMETSEADTISAKQKFEEMMRASGDLNNAMNDAVIEDLKDKLREVQVKISTVKERYADAAPQVRELAQAAASLNKQIRERKSEQVRQAQARFEAARKHEEDLKKKFQNEVELTAQMSLSLAEYERMKRDHASLKAVYQSIVERIQQLDVTLVSERPGNIVVVEPATVPVRPSSPKLPLSVAVGMILGSGAGALVAFRKKKQEL